MSLIIDAEMPHSCFNCPCVYREVDGRYFCRHSDGLLYPLYYPMTDGCHILGEIPDSHGDLKDANVILRWLNAKADNRVPVTLGEIIDFIEKQPIIVEASNGTDN